MNNLSKCFLLFKLRRIDKEYCQPFEDVNTFSFCTSFLMKRNESVEHDVEDII